MSDADRAHLIERGIGITNVVARATARASRAVGRRTSAGWRAAAAIRRASTSQCVVALAGITAYRAAFGDAKAQLGRQPGDFEGAELWIVPNPSGLNAHETIASLAAAYREPAVAAGVVDGRAP